jgi:peptidyl-prolyl cis-trans isomerase C
MRRTPRPWLAVPVLALSWLPALAQAPPSSGAAPPAQGVVATVNGVPITETALQRSLDRVLPAKRAEARSEVLDYLIDNALLDQYLLQLQIAVDAKDVEKRIEEMRAELKKRNKDFDKFLQEIKVTEPELRQHVAAEMRWDKFTDQQGTDKVLRETFEANKEMFDGTLVRARHILLTPPANDAKECEAARQQLLKIKKDIEAHVAAGLAKLPANADNLAREKARVTLTDEAFAAAAKEKSVCESKADDGDVGWFQRAGIMVEPFARAAFALKPYQMSDVVKTTFGYHLILATDRKPGREVKFEEVKEEVREVYRDRLRETVVAQMRKKAEIKLTPAKP